MKAAGRTRHVPLDPRKRAIGLVECPCAEPVARATGEREHHEGEVVQVGGRTEHVAVRPSRRTHAPSARRACRVRIVAVGRRVQCARPSERVGAGKDEDLPGLDPYPLVRHVGWPRRQIEMLDETEAGPVAPGRRPERQRCFEQPHAQSRMRTLRLHPNREFHIHGSTPGPKSRTCRPRVARASAAATTPSARRAGSGPPRCSRTAP